MGHGRWAQRVAILILALPLGFQNGCHTPQRSHELRDPFEPANRAFFDLNLTLHIIVIDPITGLYQLVIPDPVERRVSNFFSNLTYPHVIANDLLQFELRHAFASMGRLVVNTTVGIGGLFDPATRMGLPAREQSFGITASKWGLSAGPYVVLPLLGPGTVRALPDVPMRIVTNPLFYLEAGTMQAALAGGGAVDRASAGRDQFQRVHEAVNPYVFLREAYWQHQQSLIREESDDLDFFEELPMNEDESDSDRP